MADVDASPLACFGVETGWGMGEPCTLVIHRLCVVRLSASYLEPPLARARGETLWLKPVFLSAPSAPDLDQEVGSVQSRIFDCLSSASLSLFHAGTSQFQPASTSSLPSSVTAR